MADENIVNADTQNGEVEEHEIVADGELDYSDEDAVKAHIEKIQHTNAQLYVRTQKAEGKVYDDATKKWVKPAKSASTAPAVTPPAQARIDDESRINEVLENRELKNLDVSDGLRKEIDNYRKLHNVSVKEAMASEYIQFVKEKETQDDKVSKASIGAGRRTAQSAKPPAQLPTDKIDLRSNREALLQSVAERKAQSRQ